ncbi:MAG TPA: MupA/Atu3671 family FMN-dependent luciferase-like monooxygenase [Polyangiaceae bacterium]|nr:MupA/Atu3671 family FMN-dependent luciferase-like monooxygenase [Polyangiaceae bacterium]
MANRDGLSCFLMGQDALLEECGEIWLRQGHEVRGVVSASPRIVAWAERRGLSVVDPKAQREGALAREPFDYLFAITHLAIVPDEVLALPKRGAINFHDGPLPRYAGLNAPAWALIERASTYGITWHAMTAGVDTGDILRQVTFEIAEGETSLSLNTKCFAHAIETFSELARDLASGAIAPRPQVSSERTYYGRHLRPPTAGLLDFRRPAAELEALVRALHFGERYPNRLGAAKVHVGSQCYVVTEAEAREATSASPGTVVSIDDESIGVATGEGVLAITSVATTFGAPLRPHEWASALGLDLGGKLDALSAETRAAIDRAEQAWSRAEDFWAARLASAEPAEVPLARAEGQGSGILAEVRIDVPSAFAANAEAVVASFLLFVGRVLQRDAIAVGFVDRARTEALGELSPFAADTVPLSIEIDSAKTFADLCQRVALELALVRERSTYLRDLIGRHPELRAKPWLAKGERWPVSVVFDTPPPRGAELTLHLGATPRLVYDLGTLSDEAAKAIAGHLTALLFAVLGDPEQPVGKLSLLSEADRTKMLVDWNRTARSYPEACIHHLVEEQAARTPDAVALVFEDEELSYRQLNERANQLAGHLRTMGIGPEKLVGICLDRSHHLVVAALATMKAGGAYVPLDPDYPRDRLAFMCKDAGLALVVADENRKALAFRDGLTVVSPDAPEVASHSKRNLEGGAGPENLAYVIYTSGSTGTPKGVMVEHRNAVNFFAGMDERIPHDPPGVWLAVTSLSFDISVLELFWTLARGFKVVLYRDRDRESGRRAPSARTRAMEFSLFYFSSDETSGPAQGAKYELLLEGAKFADEHGFVAVWTPERHFHAFGGIYPHPAVTGAAVAAITKNVQIRAGSVVLPLHHPARVAEAWSVVDNLSGGRVGVSFASGWQPNDFVLAPANFKDAKAIMFRDIEIVKALWRGDAVEFPGAAGAPVAVRTLPRPVQLELPVWVTTAGNVETYERAGQIGANILTHLLGQSVAELAPKIEAYRRARQAHGHDPHAGVVSLMLHAFVGPDKDGVRAAVKEPLKRYLGSSLELLKQYAWSFPAFSRPKDMAGDRGDDLANLSPEERDALLDHAVSRYYETSGLFGRPKDCLAMVDELARIGVSEVACLIDFGIPTRLVLEHLSHLSELRELVVEKVPWAAVDHSLSAQIQRHRVTHLQSTPSMARMLLDDPGAKAALGRLSCWMIGGEALTLDLVNALRMATRASIIDMYGPTETTVWSTTHVVGIDESSIPIGRPIANTRVYVLDAQGEPLPAGAVGELYIAGEGVARGYLHRPELTQERFAPDPFARMGRMYRTGDLARFRYDGTLEYVGRRDHQVKIRGHRVELGEIEALTLLERNVKACVALVREDTPGDQRLVVYVVPGQGAIDEAALRDRLRARLPEFMVPAHVVSLSAFPETPNRKLDRKALPPPSKAELVRAYAAPETDTESAIVLLWQEILGREQIGVDDNFFDVGGHSLLVVRLHRRLSDVLPDPVSLTDLYRFPTVRALTRYLADRNSGEAAERGTTRASLRREMSQRRRPKFAEE